MVSKNEGADLTPNTELLHICLIRLLSFVWRYWLFLSLAAEAEKEGKMGEKSMVASWL